jgi:hypothetical protein
MEQTAVLHSPQEQALNFIFTNANYHAIFADRLFMHSLGETASEVFAGVPLNKILLLDVPTENRLMENVRKNLAVENYPISYHSAAGDVIQTAGTAIVANDEMGTFLGVDLVLKPSQRAGASTGTIASHTDVIRAYVDMETISRDPTQPRTFTQSYIVAQFNALQVMLARLNGPASRAAFEKITDNAARSMGLPISMENGCLIFSKMDIDINGYRNLMQTAVNYAVNAVGKGIVKREMLLVDKCVRPGTLELIAQMDLRIFSSD